MRAVLEVQESGLTCKVISREKEVQAEAMNSSKPMDEASVGSMSDDTESATASAGDSPPWAEAVATGLCAVLGVAGFLLQHSSITNAFYWSLVPLVGAYLAGGIRTLGMRLIL